MASNRLQLLGFLVLTLLTIRASSSRISDAVPSRVSTGRSLLQASQSCAVDFEHQNYTIITSKCRGPEFAANACCSAFKEFACPFTDEIDDSSTDCATRMFSYINLYGKYPPGLFANECREGKLGLDCSNVSSYKAVNSPKKNSADGMPFAPPPLLLISALLSSVLL